MSAKKEAPAARGGARNAWPWFASSQDKGWAGCLLLRRDAAGRSREWACCDSHARAVKLAAALNREERERACRMLEIAVRDTALAKLGDVRHALRRLVDAGAHVPVLRDGGAFAKALAEARRVLGDEPTFAPGGEEVAR